MMISNEDGTKIEGEICCNCKQIIKGALYMTPFNLLIVVGDKKINGVCVGQDWIEYYECIDCYRIRDRRGLKDERN
jgi:hypothetical protein